VSVYPPRNHYAQRAGNRRIPVMVLHPAPMPTGYPTPMALGQLSRAVNEYGSAS
jgi:hypothetical protein